MDIQPLKIDYCFTQSGRVPCREWFQSLKDMVARQKIISRLTRVERGLLGDCRSVGQGIFELRIDSGPGYRIYFGQENDQVVLPLLGGSKHRQEKDIEKAQEYWADHLRRRTNETLLS